MNNGNKYLIIIIVLLLGIIIGTQIESFLSRYSVDNNIDKFSEVLELTKRYYLEDLETSTLIESAIKGMFNELDPHTTYIAPIDQSISDEQFRGNFEGIGIEFQLLRDTITVVSPITGGPSEALGILAGDRIVEVDGENCIGFSNSDVVNTLRGEKGTLVNITIYRPSVKKILEFDIIRDEIPLFSVDASIMIDDQTGYISVSRFAETTSSEIIKALEQLTDKGMKKLVLDLRNNPGGLLSQAYKVADLFIDNNKLIVYTKGRMEEFNERLLAELDVPYEKIPLIILINRGSASGSEIVAGAVQDWDRGLIIGERSFGKGLVQRPFILEDNSAIRLTVSKYFTPSGRAIQRNYTNGREEYYNEAHNRETDADSVSNGSDDSSAVVYYTNSGRKVFGGGGIYPDYNVPSDSVTNFTVDLRRNNIYYSFIRNYLDENKGEISKLYRDADEFKKEFNFSKKDLSRFISMAVKSGIDFNENEYETDKNYIISRLKAYIARELWKNNGWYSLILSEDTVMNLALTKFDEATEMFANQK
jgi:carboxyl-terminal processing protease